MWNTTPPRQVTSMDFKRGIERICDPTLALDGNPSYYTATIAGFASFCNAFSAMDPTSSATARAAFINGHDVSGIQTPNSSMIVFTLIQPASDFLNILALPFASAAPVEDLSYMPATPGNPIYSDGPYQVSKYDVGHEIDLEHNPAWSQSTDTIRHNYVSTIDITLDMAGSAVTERVQDDLATGAADLEWNTRVPPEDITGLTLPVWNAEYGVFPQPGNSVPMVQFNVLSPNNKGALANKEVRQALEYAINKVAIGQILGGPALNQPLNQVIGPGAEGYVPFDDYPTKRDLGDPGKCKSLLSAAGYPSGLTLTDIYKSDISQPSEAEVFREVQSDFEKCGVTVIGFAADSQTFGEEFFGSADTLEAGKWDISSALGWTPDWFGPANGRAILAALFDGAQEDTQGYDDKVVDALVTQAETATTLATAAGLWHQADERVMADAAFIPIETSLKPIFRSSAGPQRDLRPPERELRHHPGLAFEVKAIVVMTSSTSNSSGSRARPRNGMTKLVAVIALWPVALAACSTIPPPPTVSSGPCVSGPVFNPVDFHPCWLAANVNAGGAPVLGGTLKIEGDQDVFAMLDPQGEYGPVGPALERAYTRQLVTYPATTNLVAAETPVPDAATGMPIVNADGLTYRFQIKSGVMWNTTPPRQVTSMDFKRGIERNCDPTLAPLGNPTYYTATIVGLASFCATFEAMSISSSAAARAAYINGNDVSGIQTPDDATIVFKLIQPASDFLNILAQPFASAAPVEDLSYVPVTPGNPIYSDGPYQVASYDVGHEIDFNHNPAWSQSTDTIRHDYVSKIDVKLDVPGTGAAEDVKNDIATGVADLQSSTRVPAEDVAALTSPVWNAQYGVFPTAGSSSPFVRFNVLSPNNNGALANTQVRQALEYAINKVAINNIFGGSSLAEPLNQVIGPGAEGYVPIDDYPTPGNMGDPSECKKLLAAAGYPDGLTLKDIYIDYLPLVVEVFPEVQSDLAKCGVVVKAEPVSSQSDFYGPADGLSAPPDVLKQPTTWDITTSTGWGPDWFGPANGRAILPDLFDGADGIPGVGDFGGYDDKAVDTLVNQAESAPTLKAAAGLWHLADEKVMSDAAFIPLQTQLTPLFRSARVHNAIFIPFSDSYDITQVWLSQSG